jgi:hypothetical protein
MQLTRRPTDELRTQIVLSMRELEALRDETKARMRLAGMKLRDRWNHFEHRHARLREAVRDVRDETLVALRAALTDHHAALADLRDDLHEDLHEDLER